MTYTPAGGSGSNKISSSQDVALNNPENNDVLTYNAITQLWANKTSGVNELTARVNDLDNRILTLEGSPRQPQVPRAMSAAFIAGDSIISWSFAYAPNDSVTSIIVHRRLAGDALGNPLTTLSGKPSSWADTSVQNGTAYVYAFTPVNEVGNGPQYTSDQVTPQAGGAPDMVVLDIYPTASDLKVGTTTAWRVDTKNLGTASTPNNTPIGVAATIRASNGGTTVIYNDTYIAPISPGVTTAITLDSGPIKQWTATAGTFTIEATVNDINRYAEIRHDNNNLSKSYTVTDDSGNPTPSATWKPSEAFAIANGIAMHLERGDTYANITNIVNACRDGYVKRIRSLWNASQSDKRDQIGVVLGREGTKFMGFTGQIGTDPEGVKRTVYELNQRVPGAAAWIEGPNEQDNNSALSGYVSTYSSSIRSDSRLAGVKVVGPSLYTVWADGPYKNLGYIGDKVDYAVVHAYTGSEVTKDAYIDRLYNWTAINVGAGRPYIDGETGFTTATNAARTTWQTGHPPVPENIQALYTLHKYLMNFRRGVLWTAIYQLVDETWETPWMKFGLFRTDWTPKKAWLVRKVMQDIVKDPGNENLTTTDLSVTLNGADAQTRTLSLQKSDGTRLFIAWQEVEPWNKAAVNSGTHPEEGYINPAPADKSMQLVIGTSRTVTPLRPINRDYSVGSATYVYLGASVTTGSTHNVQVGPWPTFFKISAS